MWYNDEEIYYCGADLGSYLQAVAYFGANFELLSKMFKGRCRKMMANKWRRENKVNEQRCKEAMSSKGGREGYERVMRSIAGLNVNTLFHICGIVGPTREQLMDIYELQRDEHLPSLEIALMSSRTEIILAFFVGKPISYRTPSRLAF